MTNKNPPFDITNKMLSDIVAIGELVGRVSVDDRLPLNPMLRRQNRIRTVFSSLAIEQNSLSIEQVTAVLSGKHVIAPPKDIAEIKNAYEIYEHMDSLDPYSVDALLAAHEVMTRGVVEESGQFRSKTVGVVDGKGNVLHLGTLPQYVPQLVSELLEWVKSCDVHMIIKSCVFHYEFELIHPFADGNGRMGRLWHTLLLSKWNPLFAWLPVESIIHDNQAEYYEAINISNDAGKSNAFIEFMLDVIIKALSEASVVHEPASKGKPNRNDMRRETIKTYLKTHDCIMNSDVVRLFAVSSSTANRILTGLEREGVLQRLHIGSHWGYAAK